MTDKEKLKLRKAMSLIHGDKPDGYTRGMNILAKMCDCDMRAVKIISRAKLVSFTTVASRPNNATFAVTLPKRQR